MSNLRFIERDGKMVLQQKMAVDPHCGYESWQDVPTHKEPKKVSVVEELEHIIMPMRDRDIYSSDELAEAAIEFFRARMPKREFADYYSQAIYNQAIKDVRKALFGEE